MSDLTGQKTEAEEKRLEPQPTVEIDFDSIINLIGKSGEIANFQDQMDTAKGSLGATYKKIQNDHHGNIAAVKKIKQLDRMTEEKASDFMRTFIGLAERMGLLPRKDMVDMAQSDEQQSSMDSTVSDLEEARNKKSKTTKKTGKSDSEALDPKKLKSN